MKQLYSRTQRPWRTGVLSYVYGALLLLACLAGARPAHALTPYSKVDLVSPSRGPVGTRVTLTGKDLDEINKVLFNGTAQTTYTYTRISAGGTFETGTVSTTVPAGATTGPVEVGDIFGASTTGGPTFTVTAAPSVTTAAVAGLTTTSAELGGTVTDDNYEAVTERGIVYVVGTGTPTVANTKRTNGTGTGTFSQTVTGLTPGTTYSVRAYAINSVGTGYGNTVQFTAPLVVTAAPSVTGPANGSLVNTALPTYNGTAVPNATVTVYVDNSVIGTATAGGTGSWTFAQSTALAQGSHTVYATAMSSGQAMSANSNTNTFTIDSVRPSVVISSTAGASGSTTSTAPIPFAVTFSENVTGFVTGDLTVSGGTASGFSGSGTSYTFNVTPATAGPVTVIVPANVAQDAASNGNTAAAGSYTILYAPATAAPVVTTPANGSQVSTATPTYTGTAVAGSTVRVYVDGSLLGTTTATGGNWSLAQPTALAQGSHTVYATAQVSGQGVSANSSTNTFTVCPAPVAVAQAATLVLSASGSATLAATAFNNGSTANCGPAPAGTLTVQKWTTGVAFGEVGENGTLTLTTPAGGRFVSVDFASYGTPAGSGGTYTVGSCNAATSLSVVQAALLGRSSGSIVASNTVFGDPCSGTVKKLAVRATYAYPAAGTPAPAAQLTYSCSDVGLNYAALLVTDASGTVSTALATVTVQDNTAPVAYVLPPAPALATANVPEAAGYGVLYQLNMPNSANFNSLTSVPYAVNNAGAALARPARVAYFMELTNTSGVSKWVWASMDNFATTLNQLGLPNPTANPVNWDQNVANLNVFASTNAGVTTGSNVGTGRLEMWRFNYGPENTNNVPGASASTYDFSDRNDNGNNYGSFQVHNTTAGQTLLAYNNWGVTTGSASDIGIGNQVGGSGNPDWTFANNAATYTVKRLYVLVTKTETSPTASFTQPASVELGASGSATVTGAQVYNGNAIDNCGSVTASVSPSTFSCANLGANTVTVTLTDGNGNTTSQTAQVTVTAPPTTPTTTWNGTANTDWNNCANWSFGKVPNATTNAVIPAGLAQYPNLTSAASVKDFTLDGSLGGTATLTISGNFSNNSSATFGPAVVFSGTAATQVLGGTTATTFTNVTVTKTTGTVQLQRDMTVTGALVFTSGSSNQGTLTTGTYRINLGTTGAITETETSYVLGKVATTRPLVASGIQSFGGIGLQLTPAPGSTAPGATTVVRTTGTALTGVDNSVSILRNFDIQPTVNTGLNVTMVFSYFTHELNSIPEANLTLFKSETGASDTWSNQRFNSRNAGSNTVTKSGITGFSIWTLGNSAAPLPVELTAFTARTEGAQTVRLAWTTASEKNSAHFVVERSLDGLSFGATGTVQAAGRSNSPRSYGLLDEQLPTGATVLYYRLRQVDQDGTFAHSPVQAVTLNAVQPAARLSVVPNPTTGAATLHGAKAGATVQVYDAVGRLVLTATADATGTARLALPAGQPTGVYVVRTGTQATRLVLE